MRRAGLQAEVVLSLGLVMLAASGILTLLLIHHNEARLRDLLGRALLAEARGLPARSSPLLAGTDWWRVLRAGSVDAITAVEEIDAESVTLARQARERDAPLLQPGLPWASIRFAAPLGAGGDVAVARLPAAASWRLRGLPQLLASLFLVGNVVVFTAFGASLLRRRVVLPLRRLSAATRELADGAFGVRLPVEGPREAAELASAFNDMGEALARRTRALEKAVGDLRQTNAELRRARAGLDRAERLASVGRLAAGVAHEVGNPMGALLAFLGLAQRDPDCSDETRRHLERAAEQGERVRRILRQLLEFSRPPQSQRIPVDLAACAEEAIGLISAQRRYAHLRLSVERESSPGRALGDPGVVAQILLNLLLNAADAASADEPQVRLEVRDAALEMRRGEGRHAAAGRRRPDAVECVVADNGCGIPDEDRERIFDPFFTSKPPGEGTGLGLANSLRLAEELGGTLELVAPPPGMSTAFAFRLPRVDSAGSCAVRSEVRCSDRRGTAEPDPKTQS
ncbi:MAG: ATP-binding protein [Myxococcota bacterium]|nr:ATP-binding protein [Myxococcota bacterium]